MCSDAAAWVILVVREQFAREAIMTKYLAYLCALGLLATAVTGCGGACSDYCDYLVQCGLPDRCSWDDENEALDECNQDCDRAYDGLSSRELDEADACMDCLDQELGGECRDDRDLENAFDDCRSDCNDDGAVELLHEFSRDFDWQRLSDC